METRWRDEIMSWCKTVAGAFLAYCAITTVAFANYSIPSESMVPAIEVGDRVVVSKFAYGYSRRSLPMNIGDLLPASEHRFLERMPARGDVIVFTHPMDGKIMIKRLVGLPGDSVEMRGGRLFINGGEAPTTGPQAFTRARHPNGLESGFLREETLPGDVRHAVHEFEGYNPLDNFGPYLVPAGHFFFMGDNRDNSLDSRWAGMGPVPMENLIGRAETVYFAPRACDDDGVSCRARWLRPMHD